MLKTKKLLFCPRKTDLRDIFSKKIEKFLQENIGKTPQKPLFYAKIAQK
jgi:hypothetical protein